MKMSSFTFPLLAHLSQWLMVGYCDHWMSVVVRRQSCFVCRQQLLQRTSPPKQLAGF